MQSLVATTLKKEPFEAFFAASLVSPPDLLLLRCRNYFLSSLVEPFVARYIMLRSHIDVYPQLHRTNLLTTLGLCSLPS